MYLCASVVDERVSPKAGFPQEVEHGAAWAEAHPTPILCVISCVLRSVFCVLILQISTPALQGRLDPNGLASRCKQRDLQDRLGVDGLGLHCYVRTSLGCGIV